MWIGSFLTNSPVEQVFYADADAAPTTTVRCWTSDGTHTTADVYGYNTVVDNTDIVADMYQWRVSPTKAGVYCVKASWQESTVWKSDIWIFNVFGPSGENVLYTSAFSFYDEDGDVRLLLQKTTGGIANKENPR